jgi:hypothetical protein
MSPLVKVTREDWISATLQLVAAGQVPANLTVKEQCDRLGVTKGSFYSKGHFPGGETELYSAVIARWLDQSALGALADTMSTVGDPLTRLRLLRARANDRARLDGTMRRWAQSDAAITASVEDAEAAVAEADDAVAAHIRQALDQLGYPADEVQVLGPLVVAGVGLDAADFQKLLSFLLRAVPRRGNVEVIEVGEEPGRKILFALMDHPTPEGLAELRARALEFQQQHGEDAGPPPAAQRPAAREGTSGT